VHFLFQSWWNRSGKLQQDHQDGIPITQFCNWAQTRVGPEQPRRTQYWAPRLSTSRSWLPSNWSKRRLPQNGWYHYWNWNVYLQTSYHWGIAYTRH
jgi:hypothetical protein